MKYTQFAREFSELVADIKEHGLIELIVIFEDRILDGKIRYQACLQAGITPHFQQLKKGENPIDFVVTQNLRRFHLPGAQRLKFKQSGKLAEEKKYDPIVLNFFLSKNLYRRHLPLRQVRLIENKLIQMRGN